MTPPPQTLVDYNAQYNKWVKDSPIGTGSSNSCNADSKYKVVAEILQNISRRKNNH